MIRVGGLVWFVMMGIWIYALLDAITTDSSLVRNLSKTTWVFIVFIGWMVGALVWFVAGRPAKAASSPATPPTAGPSPSAPPTTTRPS